MTDLTLVTIILMVCTFCIQIEKKVSWIVNLNSSCMIILTSLFFSSVGSIPSDHSIYSFFTNDCLPIILSLLVLGLNLEDMKRLEKRMLGLFLIGTIATFVGGVTAAIILFPLIGPVSLKLSSQMVASFVGGLENAVAMKEILGIPQSQFIPMFTMDNVITSFWMIITMIYPKTVQKDIYPHDKDPHPSDRMLVEPSSFYFSITIAVLVFVASSYISRLTGIHTILVITCLSLILGQVNLFKIHFSVCYLIGTLLFAPFFFSIGATGDFKSMSTVSIYSVALPFIILFFHAMLIFIFTIPFKYTRLEKAIVSQALIGGSGTAVALAQAKNSREGIVTGLILGLIGYAIGNYVALASFKISEFITNLIY